jgi:DNA-binding SARP family transcriptional activator
VSLNTLIDRVWGDDPPPTARGLLYGYMSRLRKVLGAVDRSVGPTRRSGGYVLEVEPTAVDLHLFRSTLAGIRSCTDPRQARGQLQHALHRWRGPALADLETPALEGYRVALDDELLTARVELTEIELQTMPAQRILAQVMRMSTEHPLDERIASQAIRALHWSGRSANAVRHYEQFRDRLAQELAVEPNPELQELNRRLRDRDPRLVRPDAGLLPALEFVPADHPHDAIDFVGRTIELARLGELVQHASRASQIKVQLTIRALIAHLMGEMSLTSRRG